MLILEADEICVYKDICPYNNNKCYGAKSDRSNEFICEFVDENGNIEPDRMDPLKY